MRKAISTNLVLVGLVSNWSTDWRTQTLHSYRIELLSSHNLQNWCQSSSLRVFHSCFHSPNLRSSKEFEKRESLGKGEGKGREGASCEFGVPVLGVCIVEAAGLLISSAVVKSTNPDHRCVLAPSMHKRPFLRCGVILLYIKNVVVRLTVCSQCKGNGISS